MYRYLEGVVVRYGQVDFDQSSVHRVGFVMVVFFVDAVVVGEGSFYSLQ